MQRSDIALLLRDLLAGLLQGFRHGVGVVMIIRNVLQLFSAWTVIRIFIVGGFRLALMLRAANRFITVAG